MMTPNQIIKALDEMTPSADGTWKDYVLWEAERANDAEVDRKFLEVLPVYKKMMTNFYNSLDHKINSETTWQAHGWWIMNGTFPLERIPAHARDLAQKLYYKKAKAS